MGGTVDAFVGHDKGLQNFCSKTIRIDITLKALTCMGV